MSQAGIISITASGGVTSLEADDGNIVSPAAGVIQVDGSIVANGTNAKPLFTDGATANTAIWELQVGTAVTGAPGDTNDAGIVSFDDTQFTVDADGFVQLISAGNFIDAVNVDFSTGPGTNPVLPDGSGDITITGNAVANATNANMPVASHSRAANSLTLEVQVGAAITGAPADNFDAGLVSLSDAYFSVDSNGFVEIIGDLAALEALGGVGYPTRIAADTWVQRTFQDASDGSIAVTNGNGVSGNTQFDLEDRVRLQGPYFENIGIAYNGGTGVFTVLSGNGDSFSATNPGIIVLPSKATPGEFTKFNITADQSFIDDVGASEIIDNLFGTDTGVAWASAMPFFLYAVTNDDEDTIQFMISRVPHARVSPAAANIGAPDDAVADTQGSFFSFDNIDESVFDANPCLCIGSFRMVKSASDDWTVQTLTAGQDGIGLFQEEFLFTFPTAQFGAASGGYIADNGGTAPSFTTNQYQYRILKDGTTNFYVYLNGDGGTDGAGAVQTRLSIPFIGLSEVTTTYLGSGLIASSVTGTDIGVLNYSNPNNYCVPFISENFMSNSDFGNGSRSIVINSSYFTSLA